jgi:hypothetical protein
MKAPEKTKEERVQETVRIMTGLIGAGIRADDPSYFLIKSHFDEWIKTGKPWSGSIELVRYGRRADINLPKRNSSAATLNLIAVKPIY